MKNQAAVRPLKQLPVLRIKMKAQQTMGRLDKKLRRDAESSASKQYAWYTNGGTTGKAYPSQAFRASSWASTNYEKNKLSRRYDNLAYGALRGRGYKEIENKCGHHNKPRSQEIVRRLFSKFIRLEQGLLATRAVEAWLAHGTLTLDDALLREHMLLEQG